MQFKFGVTVMNCQETNSPDAFDMLASLDAPDTYFNMKYAIFDKYTEELEFYFNSKDPEVWLLMDGEDTCLSSFVCNDTNQRGFEDLWSKPGKTIVSEKGIDTRLTTGPFRITDKTTLQVLVGADQCAWGLRLVTATEDSETETVDTILNGGLQAEQLDTLATKRYKLTETVDTILNGGLQAEQLDTLATKRYKLCSVLGGDIEFINKVVGLQGCSATYPCYHCGIELKTLRGRKAEMKRGPLRTREQAKEQLDTVLKEKLRKRQKFVARSNGSQANPPLIPVDFNRLLLAPLHIILGVTKKIWDNLIGDLQTIDGTQDGQRKKLTMIRDLLLEQVKELKEEEAANETALKDAKERKSVIKDLLTECRKASPVNYNEEATLLESLAGASKVAKECADMKSQKDKRGCLCLEAVLGDINQYLKLRRGKYERVLEHVIETVINCKIGRAHV